ncbi:hypothetical protein AV530_007452 [Patagioenas fasciata monilis]|uniref:Uncharacterized protein n=1 Tax=Patagioenas fasciata monilis TaxID=372326 RepID=A0A1V4JXT1_PATFA|nr:hypothetical protein AV530_007452 [Patagioenas fasciata monilis]
MGAGLLFQDKTSSQLWNRGHLGLRSCSTRGWISSQVHGWGVAQLSLEPAFHIGFISLPHLPFLLTHPLPSYAALFQKGPRGILA